jgi:cyclophilin family peptidyl-prolyl cis-trans isomerase
VPLVPRSAALIVIAFAALVSCTAPGDTPGAPASSAAVAAPGDHFCAWTAAAGNGVRSVGTPMPYVASSGIATLTLTTNLGRIDVRLDRSKIPCAVASFAFLAKSGYFANSTCHRLVAKELYIVQCGDPSGTGRGGPGYQFVSEALPRVQVDPSPSISFADPQCAKDPTGCRVTLAPKPGPTCPITDADCATTDGSNVVYPRGIVALANPGGLDTNGSQFFIVWRDVAVLPPTYVPLGTVTAGMDIVDRVAAGGTSTDTGDGTPKVAITITAAAMSG